MESLVLITTETEKQQQRNDCPLKLMSVPELLHSLTVLDLERCLHISCVASDRVWVSDVRKTLILIDTYNYELGCLMDSCYGDLFTGNGPHTMNCESELIYIDTDYNIKKLCKDMNTEFTFIERTDSRLEPQCVYCSLFNRDLLVGMYNYDTDTGKVTQYKQS